MPRITKQKRILYQAMHKSTTLFNAEELYQHAFKKIGLATIYRFLKTAEDAGNHIHFHCEKCGLITHITIKNADFLHEELPGKVCHFQIDITGICDDCLKKIV
ncbi:transcriptional repressor [Candidatus Woesearchaeota archaeon]|nr:transcriptional repressor [Candidatus Woesearchaeota archaeon]